MNLRARVGYFLNKIHLRMFGHEMSSDMAKFIENLGWVFAGTILAKFLLFIVQIVGGRVLGPEIYGRYNMIVTISSFLIMPILLISCAAALVKYVPSVKTKKEKSEFISTSKTSFLIGLLGFMTLYVFIFVFFGDKVISLLNINTKILLLSLIGALAWVLYSYSENLLKSLNKQKTLSIITVVSHIFTIGVFFILMLFFKDEYLLFIPIFGGYIIYSLFSVYKIKEYLVDNFRWDSFRKLIEFNKYIFIVAIAHVFLGNIDKIMLNLYLGAASVGLYHAYYTSSIIITSVLVMAFVNVFFPTINQFKDKRPILKKLNKLIFVIIPIMIVALPIQLYIIVKYAYNYPVFPITLILFSICTIIIVNNSIYASLFTSINLKSVKYYSRIIIFTVLLNIGLNITLIPRFALTGAILATIITVFLELVMVVFLSHRLLKDSV